MSFFNSDEVTVIEANKIFNQELYERPRIDLLREAVGLLDLTSLEGNDTPEKIKTLAKRALRPDNTLSSVAAVCVYPARVAAARSILDGTDVKVAAVAGAFPSGLSLQEVVISDVASTSWTGADEIDIVMDRSLFLDNKRDECREILIRQISAAGVPVKIILETGELKTLENIADATQLAIEAGATFVKTSTGKISIGASPEAVYVMSEVVRNYFEDTGRKIGIKISGNVKTSNEALGYLNIVEKVLGRDWINPNLVRIGASTLLDDICMQIRALGNEHY